MTNSNKDLADGIKKSMEIRRQEQEKNAGKKTGSGILGDRLKTVGELSRGERVKKVQYRVETSQCRLWERHNRRFDLLNEHRCADLIEGFKSMGKQEFPAIVRRVDGDPKHGYEIICGARRFWTAGYLGWKLLVEVRDLTDEEAFRLSDVENRDRDDISDYERALDYKTALHAYYDNQGQMAERMDVSQDWLSRFLALADLPVEIVSAYRDVTEIKVRHVRELSKALKTAKLRKALIAKAKELHDKKLDGKQVIAQLKQAAIDATQGKKSPSSKTLAQYKSSAGKPMMAISMKGKSGLLVSIDKKSGASKSEIKDACIKAIEAYYE
ncbi:MAG: ParB/RepB/Spo0J family partition protein [Gammaproteobacteria bacterium]|nr:ParB/RepB/Spo0J family partition protein [Gammaproteobacteria bacterium]